MQLVYIILQANFVEKNTQLRSENMSDIIRKSLGEFIDDLNQPNDSKSITNCLRSDLVKFTAKLKENVIISLQNFLQT